MMIAVFAAVEVSLEGLSLPSFRRACRTKPPPSRPAKSSMDLAME
jgi:hypothetical protein